MNAPPFPAGALTAARDAAKAYLRIEGDQEDAVIEGFAASAMALCEAFTGQALVARAFETTMGASAQWQALPIVPVTAIGALTGLPTDGAEFALPAGAYAIDIDGSGRGWLRVTAPGAAGRVTLEFDAGLAAEWEDVPAPLAQGVVLLIAHLFAGREGGEAPPAAVSALWRPWRRLRLSVEHGA